MEISRTATDDTTTWTAVLDGAEVAWLSVWTINGEICDVETRSTHRGQGLARALFEHADAERSIFHTIPAHRTEEGDMFASRIGGDEIDEADALVIECCCCDHCNA
jgi:GNAT superfamily N-acetyltransferase